MPAKSSRKRRSSRRVNGDVDEVDDENKNNVGDESHEDEYEEVPSSAGKKSSRRNSRVGGRKRRASSSGVKEEENDDDDADGGNKEEEEEALSSRASRRRKLKQEEEVEKHEVEEHEKEAESVEPSPRPSSRRGVKRKAKEEQEEAKPQDRDPVEEKEEPNTHEEPNNADDDENMDVDDENKENVVPSTPAKSTNAATIPTPLKNVNPVGKPAEAGIIKRVYVENFMCHRKLTVDLCRNVNFIHGQNGSGKSAILAAIQICLGAGAKRTHRARNLKELVRKEAGTDCSGAKVRVTLLNRGEDGYEQETYGNAVTVERCISLRGGYNGYKLLDETGKERSRAKKDLDAMLDQLNIQVENPVAVLDQEEAKKFLTGKPEDKYQFFTKATELERIDRSYASVMDNVDELDETQHSIRSSLAGLADNVKKLKSEWEQFQELDKLEDKVLDLKVVYAWSCYNALDAKVKDNESIANEVEAKMAKRRQELAKAESAANVTDDEENVLKEQMQRLTDEAEDAAKAKETLEADLKKAMAPVKMHEREASAIKRESHQAKKRLKLAQKHLQDARDQILAAAGNAQTEEAKRLAKVNKTESDISDERSKLDPLKEEIASSLRKYEEMEPHVDQAKQNASSVTGQLHMASKKVKDLQSSSGNSMAVFGQKCTAMHAKVEEAQKARRFRGPVVGPIGLHIKIAPGKEAFAKIAEHAIGNGTLDRFIVTNDHDRQLYMKLRRDVGCSTRDCGVFQLKPGRRYRIPDPPSEPEVETVASVLSIAEDLVFNCLVDNARIDTRAVAMSKEDSERVLLHKDENGRDSIVGGKIKEVFFLPHGDHWKCRAGSRSMISNERKLKQTIGIDRTAAIEEARKEVDLLDSELKDCRSKEADLLKRHKEYKVQWNQANRAHKASTKKIEKLQQTLDELKAEADSAENITIDTSELEEDVKLAEEAIEQVKEKDGENSKALEKLMPSVNEIKNKRDETTMRNEKVLDELTSVEKKIEEYVKGHAQRQATVEKKRTKVQQLEDVLGKQNEVIADLVEKRSEANLKARLLTHKTRKEKKSSRRQQSSEGQVEEGDHDTDVDETNEQETGAPTETDLEEIDPIPTEKEPNFYKAKIERMTKQIEKERERRQISEADPEVALEKYQRAKRDLDGKMVQVDTIKANVDVLVEDMRQRRKRWKEFRKHIGEMTNTTFDEMLNKKGSSGEIEFDHNRKTLDLCVQKDNSNEMTQTNDVKALSGGERSFTTLSLLLALGESLETPFRVMDEFDVFLDPMARKIALDTMVTVAKDLEHRQFIFITPQDVSSLKTDPMLKIFHMKAPARNQTVGGPSQSTLDF